MKLVNESDLIPGEYIAIFEPESSNNSDRVDRVNSFKVMRTVGTVMRTVGSANVLVDDGEWVSSVFLGRIMCGNFRAGYNLVEIGDLDGTHSHLANLRQDAIKVFKLDDDEILNHIVAMSI